MIQGAIQFFKEMSPIKLALLAFGILVFLLIFGIYLLKIEDNDLAVLYSDLEIQDSARVVEELDRRGVNYQTFKDGTVIKVRKSEVVKTRLELAQSGLPSSGSVIGYEIFDKEDSLSTTNFAQNIKFIRALEGELSRTIGAFDQVEKARVHLVVPQREIFSKERTEPRASVVLKFRGNKKLGKAEIDAISHLVVTSVPGLEMSGVTIVDTKGNALKIGSAEEDIDFTSGKNEEIRIASEERLRQVIENLLESTLGAGKVKARVALEMNFDRVVTNSELYDPDGSVVRSTHAIDEKDQTPVGEGGAADASVANNIPGGGGGGAADSSRFAITEKSDQITNYEISKTIKNHISEVGLIKKMSIGILVDGTYKKNPENQTTEYIPRSKEDLDKIVNLVKVAVGFDEERNDKIEVINMKFSSEFEEVTEEDRDWIKEQLPSLFQTLVFAIVVLLVLTTVIRPIALKAFELKRSDDLANFELSSDIANSSQQSAVAGQMVTSAGGGGSVASSAPGIPGGPGVVSAGVAAGFADGHIGIEGGKKLSDNVIQRVNEIVDTNPQDLVNVLRKWLNEGN